MANRFVKKVRQWLTVKEPVFKDSTNLKDVSENTIKELTAAISYNKKVVDIAILSGAIWITLLLCYCYCTHSCATFFDIKVYPVPLWAAITGAFNEAEKLEKKKKLNEFINKYVGTKGNPLKTQLTNTAWDEYKNL